MISRRDLQKFLDMPRGIPRLDPATVDVRNWREVLDTLEAIHFEYEKHLDQGTSVVTRKTAEGSELLVERALPHINDVRILDQIYQLSMPNSRLKVKWRMRQIVRDVNHENIPEWFALMVKGKVLVPYIIAYEFTAKVKELLFSTHPLVDLDPVTMYFLDEGELEQCLPEKVAEALGLLRDYHDLNRNDRHKEAGALLPELNEALSKLSLNQLANCYFNLYNEPSDDNLIDPHFCAALEKDLAAGIVPLPVVAFIANKSWYPKKSRDMAAVYLKESIGSFDFPPSDTALWILFVASRRADNNMLDVDRVTEDWGDALEKFLEFERSFLTNAP